MSKISKVNKRPIIVFCIPSLHTGGIEHHLVRQLSLFDHSKYDIRLITLFHNKNSPSLYHLVPEQVNVSRLEFKPGFDIKNIINLFNLIRNIKPDIVLSSMVFPNTIVRAFQPVLRYKAIAREHNTYFDKKARHILRDHFFSKFSTKIVAISDDVARFSSKQSNIQLNNFLVIHNGIDLDSISEYIDSNKDAKEKIIKEFDLPKKVRFCVNVARLKPQKNQKLLIESFSHFIKNNGDFVLFILGVGSEMDALKKLVNKLQLVDKVILAGYRDDVFAFYAASDFSVLTSDYEGFATVGIESMACGTPFISTRCAGIGDYLQHMKNGAFIDRDVENISKTFSLFANKDLKLEMKKHCLSTANNFSMINNVKKYDLLFEQLLNNSVPNNYIIM